MIAQETWRRFLAHWPKLMLAGLFAMLLYGAVALIASLIMMPMLMAAGLGMAGAAASDPGSMAALASLAGQMIGLFLLVAVLIVALAPLAAGGLIHTVIQIQRDEPVSPGDFWSAGMRNYGRLLVLMLLTMLIFIPTLVVMALLMLIPVLGAVVAVLAGLALNVVFGGYAPYIMLAEDLSAGAALSKAFRILTTRFWDVLLAGLVIAGAGFCLALISAVLTLIPVIGLLANLAINIVLTPLLALYLATRYETNIAPAFPPGGVFHPSPPPGP